MSLKYVKTKEELPDYIDFKCPICFDNINIDELLDGDEFLDGQYNCVICENGHRIHNSCFKKMKKHECPICKSNDIRFCKSKLGYSYAERKGGKKRKTNKKRKICKKGKTKNNRRFTPLKN